MIYQKIFFKKKIIIDIILIAVFCSIYTYWFFQDMDKQGMYWDVAIFGNAALSVKDNIADYYCDVTVNFFGKKIPLMLNKYIAGTDIYATLPWVYLFGNKPIALNIPSFIWGVLSSILTYLLCMRLYRNRIYSACASLILVTSPPFIIAGRIGLFTGNATIFFALAVIFLLCLWQEKKERLWLFLMGLFMGIGLACRLQFLCLITTTFIYILFRKNMRYEFFIPKNIIVCMLGIIIGAFSLILGNLLGNFLTLQFLSQYGAISYTGLSNLNYPANLLERLKEAVSLMNSSGLCSITNHLNYLGMYLFITGILFILAGIFYRHIKNQFVENNNQLLPLFIFISVLIQSPFTTSLFHVHHIISLLPFMGMIYSMPLYTALKIIKNDKKSVKAASNLPKRLLHLAGTGVILIMIVSFVLYNYKLLAVYKLHRNLHSGQQLKWNVMPDVIHFLDDKGIKNIRLGDMGLKDTILFLTNFSLGVDEVFYRPYTSISKAEQEKNLKAKLNNEKEGYYLFRTEESSIVHFFSDFQKIAADCNKKVKFLREFKTPDDVVVYRIYKIY